MPSQYDRYINTRLAGDFAAELVKVLEVGEKQRSELVLNELQHRNNLRNDGEAYVFELVAWGLGKCEKRPSPMDYGVGVVPIGLALDGEL